ncbi:MAG TPA: hypothetical protein VLZ75_12095 [Chitinophagales bacterium]|nr:hypothetical protein [Chitinophagales bacterium]
MTDTLIALISIFMGLISANLFGLYSKKNTLGFTGNTIVGIFGSIFFIKTFSRLGFGAKAIMVSGEMDVSLFLINMLVSSIGGIVGLILVKIFIRKMNSNP